MLDNIKLTKIGYQKKEGTKTVWEEIEKEEKTIDEQYYNNIVDAKHFFQNLSGTERHTKGYTSQGYKVIEIVSTSPDKQQKSIYQFDFDR